MKKVYEYSVPFDSGNAELPFEINFNFAPFIKHVRASCKKGVMNVSQEFMKTLDLIEEKGILSRPFSDINIVKENIDDIEKLMSPVFPDILRLNQLMGLIVPFRNCIINPTERLDNLLKDAKGPGNIVFEVEANTDPYIGSSILILNMLYNANIDFGSLYHFNITNKNSGLTKYFRSLVNVDFATLRRKPDTPELTYEDIQELKNNLNNVNLWMDKIPPNGYAFEGISILSLVDVSREKQESKLKQLLLKNDVLDDPVLIDELISLFRSYLGISDLELGLVAYDSDMDRTKPLGFGLWKSILLKNDQEACSIQQLGTDVVQHLKDNNNELIVNLDNMVDEHCDASQKFVAKGIGSYAIFPLSYDGKLIALIEMSSKEKRNIDLITGKKFENIKDVFTTSIKRYLDQYDVNLEAIIKEKCTALHPTVEWRFKEEAETYHRNKLNGVPTEMEDLDFPDVNPLYGQIDIKDSSLKRNAAIKDDLLDQLKDLKKIMEIGYKVSSFPYYNQLLHKINSVASDLKSGLGVGDEVAILDFIKKEIEVNLEHIQSLGEESHEFILKYRKKLKGENSIFNNRREYYEKSVSAVTRTITDMMLERQDKAQEMYPHYYEKYKTDGVEHNIYIGNSLVKGRKYYPLYLKNLRLWQLMSIIEIENRLHDEKSKLKVDLDVCSLVLVHSNPITIRFRMDEKKFDVEGAYNIRYEIIKKRIDKSLINNSKERLTQPGKLAIVFAHPNEEKEYKSYLSYLYSIGYIKEDIEVVDLAPVQGINGLKALRVSINYREDMDMDASIRMLEATMN